VAEAELTENPIVIEEAMTRAVNRVVKWFILILVSVFDPLAVTLVIAYNASLLKGKEPLKVNTGGSEVKKTPFFSFSNAPVFLLLITLIGWFTYDKFNPSSVIEPQTQKAKASFLNKLSTKRFDDRSFAYLPEKTFGVFSFSGLRMVEQVGLPKIISDDFVENIPFLNNLAWSPEECGINPYGRVLYFLQFPGDSFIEEREQDVVWGIIIPIGDSGRLREFITRKLELKSLGNSWRVSENESPSFVSFNHRTEHISLGMDEQCLVILSSWWSDQKDHEF